MNKKETNVKKHPRQLRSGRTKVKRHKRRVPFHKKQMTIDKGDYEHYYNQKSKRAKTMDEKSTAKKTHKGEVLNIPYRKNRDSKETRNYLIKKTGQMDWEGVDTKKEEKISKPLSFFDFKLKRYSNDWSEERQKIAYESYLGSLGIRPTLDSFLGKFKYSRTLTPKEFDREKTTIEHDIDQLADWNGENSYHIYVKLSD